MREKNPRQQPTQFEGDEDIAFQLANPELKSLKYVEAQRTFGEETKEFLRSAFAEIQQEKEPTPRDSIADYSIRVVGMRASEIFEKPVVHNDQSDNVIPFPPPTQLRNLSSDVIQFPPQPSSREDAA